MRVYLPNNVQYVSIYNAYAMQLFVLSRLLTTKQVDPLSLIFLSMTKSWLYQKESQVIQNKQIIFCGPGPPRSSPPAVESLKNECVNKN